MGDITAGQFCHITSTWHILELATCLSHISQRSPKDILEFVMHLQGCWRPWDTIKIMQKDPKIIMFFLLHFFVISAGNLFILYKFYQNLTNLLIILAISGLLAKPFVSLSHVQGPFEEPKRWPKLVMCHLAEELVGLAQFVHHLYFVLPNNSSALDLFLCSGSVALVWVNCWYQGWHFSLYTNLHQGSFRKDGSPCRQLLNLT